MKHDLSKISNIGFEGINHDDYPDFCDAYISEAEYKDRQLTEEELEWLNENETDFRYEQLIDYLF